VADIGLGKDIDIRELGRGLAGVDGLDVGDVVTGE
jgi:hypothetical protein